jgi:hypothetical protein
MSDRPVSIWGIITILALLFLCGLFAEFVIEQVL